MEEIRWWTWMLLVCAVIALVLLISGPLGYKYEIFPLGQAMGSTLVAYILADCVLLISLVMIYKSNQQGLILNRTWLGVAMAMSLVPAVVMSLQLYRAMSVPPIHDISTDTSNPPVFYKITGIRKNAPNPLTYGTEDMPRDRLVKLQTKNYPEIKSLPIELGQVKALDLVQTALKSLNIAVVNRDDRRGVVEGVATTFWFGFKDDVVVRVKPVAQGSLIDIRSISRVGKSDLGANAARIKNIIAAILDE